MNTKTVDDSIVKIAKALSDKTRILILKEIAKKDGLSCGDVEQIAGLSQPTISHHLKVLADADLLTMVKYGRCVLVSLNKKTFDEFCTLISDSIQFK
ncbi:MAG: helix-turn-helix domain-containing protein [Ignavibacteriaceae bacterium]